MAGKSVILKLLGNPSGAQEALDLVEDRIKEVAKGAVIPVTADAEQANADLDDVDFKIKTIRGKPVLINVEAEAAQANAKLDETAQRIVAINKDKAVITIAADGAEANGELDKLELKIHELTDKPVVITPVVDSAPATAESSKMGKAMNYAALGVVALAAGSIKLGMDFQTMTTQLVTGAGQSEKGLAAVKQGLLQISSDTGTSIKTVVDGMYMIESAGFKGAEGLKILRAAAEGAKVGNADLGTVADGVTSVLKAYHLGADQAVSVTNQLVTTVASGKMHMSDLVAVLGTVVPSAAAAHISLAQVGASIATMTAQGMPANRAATSLRFLIASMVNPTKAAAAEMQNYGLSAESLGKNLGEEGISGTLDEMTASILRNTKGGVTLAASFDQMSAKTKAYAEAALSGKLTTEDLSTAVKGLSIEQGGLLTRFAGTAAGAQGVSKTYVGALAGMVGGTRGLSAALTLTGTNAAVEAANVKAIAFAADHAGNSVKGWATIQKDASFQLDKTKTSAENVAIELGDAMLPTVTNMIKPISTFAGWLVKFPALAKGLGLVAAGFLGVWVALKLGSIISGVYDGISGGISKLVKMLGFQKVATEEATVAQGEMDVSMDANPIGVVIIAIALLCVGIYELIKHWSWVKSVMVDLWGWIKGAWSEVYNDILAPFGRATLGVIIAVRNMAIAVDNGVIDIMNFFIRLPGDILGALGNLGSMLWNAGWNIIIGLWNGIVSAYNQVIGWIEHLASNIMSAFSNIFKFGSPSKAMHQRGLWIGQGLALGIKDSIPHVLDAVNGMTNAATPKFGSVRGPSGSSSSSTPAANGGTTVNLAVTVSPLANPDETAAKIQTMLLNLKRHRGKADLGLA
jgi:TP901 family phage tail tape measure protein